MSSRAHWLGGEGGRAKRPRGTTDVVVGQDTATNTPIHAAAHWRGWPPSRYHNANTATAPARRIAPRHVSPVLAKARVGAGHRAAQEQPPVPALRCRAIATGPLMRRASGAACMPGGYRPKVRTHTGPARSRTAFAPEHQQPCVEYPAFPSAGSGSLTTISAARGGMRRERPPRGQQKKPVVARFAGGGGRRRERGH